MLTVRVLTPDDWPTWRVLRLRALEEAPYAFSSKLAEWTGEGDREERWRSRLETVPSNFVAELGGEPAGMASLSAADDAGVAELMSMWVAPEARGRGVGDALVAEIVTAARLADVRHVMLWVVDSNAPAVALYRRNGFADALVDGRPHLEDGERRMVLPVD